MEWLFVRIASVQLHGLTLGVGTACGSAIFAYMARSIAESGNKTHNFWFVSVRSNQERRFEMTRKFSTLAIMVCMASVLGFAGDKAKSKSSGEGAKTTKDAGSGNAKQKNKKKKAKDAKPAPSQQEEEFDRVLRGMYG
jgi:hypothetical protein